MRVFAYKNCGTCKKAGKWLTEHGLEFEEIDITQHPPSREELAHALTASGLPLARLFNTSGQSYRQGDFKNKLKTMTQEEALDALAADGKLIKRPLIFARDRVLVGFEEESYRKAFSKAR